MELCHRSWSQRKIQIILRGSGGGFRETRSQTQPRQCLLPPILLPHIHNHQAKNGDREKWLPSVVGLSRHIQRNQKTRRGKHSFPETAEDTLHTFQEVPCPVHHYIQFVTTADTIWTLEREEWWWHLETSGYL